MMCLPNNQNVGNLLLFVVSHGGVKMTESFAANTVSRFRCAKTGEESKLLQESFLSQLPTKLSGRLKFWILISSWELEAI